MKQFLFKTVFFLVGFVLLVLVVSFASKKYVEARAIFTIKPTTTNIILGHSQPECGLNDSLIINTENFSQGGESYFYTYQKVKKLLAINKKIDNVFISFSNNQIAVEMDKWTYGDVYINNYYPKYSFMMDYPDYKLLLKNNYSAVVRADFKAVINNTKFIIAKDKSYLKDRNWGGYLKIKWNKIDSLVNKNYLEKLDKKQFTTLSDINIHYLHKIIDLCTSKKVGVILFRTPIHERLYEIQNEELFKKVKNENFKQQVFLDFSHFPIAKNGFADFSHLNYAGATAFSKFFNAVLKKDVFHSKNAQQIINHEISNLKIEINPN
jgi:hypothetical protein